MKPKPPDPAAHTLAALQGEEQAAFALTLLTPRTRRDTLRAALAVVQRLPLPAARPALCHLIEHYAANGGALDFGGYLRSDALRALRPLAEAADLPLLLRCVATYEFPPPAFKEETALLRSAALVALVEVDETLARCEAARLLVDEHTDPMSGEPARSAAQVLAACGDLLPLYQFATDARHSAQSEVVAEALRGLEMLPAPLLPGLIARFDGRRAPVVQVGLIDLLLRHPARSAHIPDLMALLRAAPIDVARYLVFALAACADDALLAALTETLRLEKPDRFAALRDGLELLRAHSGIAALLDRPPPRRR